MTASGASDGNGSGIYQYIFIIDNNQTNSTVTTSYSTTKSATTGTHTCSVAAVDRAR